MRHRDQTCSFGDLHIGPLSRPRRTVLEGTIMKNGTEQIVEALLRERTVLRMAVYRLETLRYFVTRGDIRFFETAIEEAQQALHALDASELERQVALDRLARHMGVPTNELTLRRLAETEGDHAPLFAQLHTSFQGLTTELIETGNEIRVLAGDRSGAISNVVRMVLGAGDATGTYRPNGQRAPSSYRIDRVV